MTERPHGRTKYVVERCRCDVCRAGAREYERHRQRQRAYGRHAYVDATPVREHVQHLQAEGMGWKRIARAAGLGESVVWKLLYGDPTRNMAPSKRVRPTTAEKLLSVTLDLANGVRVPAGPTWLRIHGLIALGYSKSWIARQLGSNTPALQLSGESVLKVHADAVERLAEQYATIPGPSIRARRYAAARGWTPDLLWIDPEDWTDHAEIDDDVDEIAVERATRGEPVNLNHAERAEAMHRLLALGVNKTEIARRLRLSGTTVDRLLDETEGSRNVA